MSCYYPKLAIDFGVMPDTGKHKIKFLPERADNNINLLRSRYGEMLLLLPCGKCLGCKFDKAKDWAIRASLEMQYHTDNSFITLTYDDGHLPKRLDSVKNDLRCFVRKLRAKGYDFKYLGCAEKGETTGRLHGHICLFGYKPRDIELFSKSGKDFLYLSKEVADVWNKGQVLVGDLTYESAGYVARYTTKKVDSDDGCLISSNRPGLGYQYLVDHKDLILNTGKVYGQFGKSVTAKIPRYFEKFLMDDPRYENIKMGIISDIRVVDNNSMICLKVGNLEELKIYQSNIADTKLSRFERKTI